MSVKTNFVGKKVVNSSGRTVGVVTAYLDEGVDFELECKNSAGKKINICSWDVKSVGDFVLLK